jgi:hypothetical protein
MSPKDLIEAKKIYSEELQQWVVPLIFVDEALQIKNIQDIEQNVSKLTENLQQLDKLLIDLNNTKFND